MTSNGYRVVTERGHHIVLPWVGFVAECWTPLGVYRRLSIDPAVPLGLTVGEPLVLTLERRWFTKGRTVNLGTIVTVSELRHPSGLDPLDRPLVGNRVTQITSAVCLCGAQSKIPRTPEKHVLLKG